MNWIRKSSLVAVLLVLNVLWLSAQQRITHREYIETYKNLAILDQEIYGIPASITMAQGLLESDCGNSRLAVEANNHFGIKCKRDWTGLTILHDDDARDECFRRYDSAQASYNDHSEFLDKSPRYQFLFDLDVTDYKGWAHGLKQAGYATNPRYAHLLIKLIEDHKLYLLDRGVDYAEVAPPKKDDKPKEQELVFTPTEKIDIDNYMVAMHTIGDYPVYTNNGSEFIIAREGDTYQSLSKLVRLSEKRLRKFNDVSRTAQPKSGELVYIKSKANKATNGKLMHIVVDGDTMHSISQMYGIKLKRLAKTNNRKADSRVTNGEQIRLM